ncbi:conjugal transfer protein TraG N-terminal domain-containing protein, partial [Pseudomonas citronellolis]|uniref:conjugal transfer protein TraG N-terminal domain-containing protein n=1 Tax=Pseudomonas citronellolis TaxID=53408 RepID=UPI00248E381F
PWVKFQSAGWVSFRSAPTIGSYQLQVAMTMTVIFFALIFVDFWFQLARWIDSTILDALYGSGSPYLSFDPLMGINTATQDTILNFVMGTMFLVFPAFWITAIGWAGVKTGGVLDGLARGTANAQAAGEQGGKFMGSAITRAGDSVIKP